MWTNQKKPQTKFSKVYYVISTLQREYSDANGTIFIKAFAIERKQYEPRGAGVVISLACHPQKKSEVMFISVGIEFCGVKIIYSCSDVAL